MRQDGGMVNVAERRVKVGGWSASVAWAGKARKSLRTLFSKVMVQLYDAHNGKWIPMLPVSVRAVTGATHVMSTCRLGCGISRGHTTRVGAGSSPPIVACGGKARKSLIGVRSPGPNKRASQYQREIENVATSEWCRRSGGRA